MGRSQTIGWRNGDACYALRIRALEQVGHDVARLRVGCAASLAIVALALLGGCGGGKPMPSTQEAQLPAETRVGDVTARVTTLPTLRLNQAMAAQYGVARDARTVLVVVGLRRGDAASETSLPGRIRAQATNLLGSKQTLTLREVRSDGFIDYVGTATVSMPDTLHYEIDAQPEGGPALSLRFNRDYFAEGGAGSQ